MIKYGFSNKGVSVVEYALLAALIGTASVLAVTTFGTQTASLFEREDFRLVDSNGGGDDSSGGSTGSGDGLGDHRATQNLDMSLFRIVNVDDPLNPSDAATKGYVDTAVSSISTSGDDLGNHTATQNLNLATNRIVSLGAPQDPADATTKAYVDAAVAGISGGDNLGDHTATQNIVLGNNWLSGDGENEGLFVAANGNVGIGTNTPATTLEITAAATNGLFRAGQLQLKNSSGNYVHNSAGFHVFPFSDGHVYLNNFDGGFVFRTGASVERMRIDALGRLGLGATPSSARLEVANNFNTVARFVQQANSLSNGTYTVEIDSSVHNSNVTAAGALAIRTAGRPNALTVTGAGNVGIDHATPRAKLHALGGSILSTMTDDFASGSFSHSWGRSFLNPNGYIWSTIPGADTGNANLYLHRHNTSQPYVLFGYGVSTIASISTNGSSVFYNTGSDYRLKDDFRPLENALDRVTALNPQRFVFRSDESRQVIDGFVAHEVAEVLPYAVTGEKDAVDENGNPKYQQVDYGKLTPLLTAALQELASKNQSLELENAEIRRENARILEELAEIRRLVTE